MGVERGDGEELLGDGLWRLRREEEGCIERREARGAGVGVVSMGSKTTRGGGLECVVALLGLEIEVVPFFDGSSGSSVVGNRPPGEGMKTGMLEIRTQFWRL